MAEEAGKAAALAAVAEAVSAGRRHAAVEVPINGDGSLVKAIGKAIAAAPGGGADVAFLGVTSNGKDKASSLRTGWSTHWYGHGGVCA